MSDRGARQHQTLLTVAGCLSIGVIGAAITVAQWHSLIAILCASGLIALSAATAPFVVILVARRNEPPRGRHWARK